MKCGRNWIALLAVVLGTLIQQGRAVDFWVAPDGSNASPGTKDKPLASIDAAQRKARDLRRLKDPAIKDGIHIILRGGIYRLESPLLFRWEDSGTEARPTIIEAAPGEHPVLSGGQSLTGWHKLSEEIPGLPAAARTNLWISDPPKADGRTLEIRQLWVNDHKAVRARQPNAPVMDRLTAWDVKNQTASIPASLAGPYHDISRLELVIHQQWEIAILRVKSLRTNNNTATLTFQQPESQIQFEHPWPAPVMSATHGNAPFFLVNAAEFLDQPGEWFQEMPGGRVLYWPRPGEDLAQPQAIVPVSETIVQISGNLDRPVEHLRFQGLSFEHTAWNRPALAGHVPLQAGMHMLEAYSLAEAGTDDKPSLENQAWIGRPVAAVTVTAAHHIEFERCQFRHLSATGLDFISGTHNDLVEGCTFRDIGGNGLLMGKFSDEGIETHIPYNPADEREICTHERIADNLVTDCANDDWGCLGICVGYAREVTIEHNEVSYLPYSGISLGWGWTRTVTHARDNRIHANNIHHVGQQMCDLAGIYILSAQPGTLINENSVHDIQLSPYVHRPHHWFYLYLDEGSAYLTLRDNWSPEARFLKNNNGPGNTWTNNGPEVSVKIKDTAGLDPAFRDLLSPP